jgi:hypothetical protein
MEGKMSMFKSPLSPKEVVGRAGELEEAVW